MCKDCPRQLEEFMRYTRSLDFEEKPDIAYMRKLFTDLAGYHEINLDDGLYDWNIRAITIKEHPSFFDFIAYPNAHPFGKNGKFIALPLD